MTGINKNSVSLAGEFLVLSQLALRGYDANMTLGHTKYVDILVSDPKTGAMYQLEVKTTFGNGKGVSSYSKLFGLTTNWIMSEKHDGLHKKNLFYCFVDLGGGMKPRFFIVPSKVVARYTTEEHKLYLNQRDKKRKDNPMRQFRIGHGEAKDYQIPTPLATQYENNWEFKIK